MDALDQARELDDDAIGTQHVLLAIVRGNGPAASIVGSAGATVSAICAELGINEAAPSPSLTRVMTIREPDVAESVQLPLTRTATKVLKSAWREADALSHKTIEPEHILLGILDVPKGTAFKVLTASGIDPAALRGKLVS